jgi:hypothetical protein
VKAKDGNAELKMTEYQYFPKKKIKVAHQWTIKLNIMKNLFDKINVPQTIPEKYWYQDVFYSIDIKKKLFKGNGLNFEVQGKDINSIILKDNEVKFEFESKFSIEDPKFVYEDKAITLNKAQGLVYYDCGVEAKEQTQYKCTKKFQQKIDTSEQVQSMGGLPAGRLFITTGFEKMRRTRFTFFSEEAKNSILKNFKILLYDYWTVGSKVHILALTEEKDDEQKIKREIKKIVFEGLTANKQNSKKFQHKILFKISEDLNDLRKINCLQDIQYDLETSYVYYLDNCGIYQNAIHRFKFDKEGRKSQLESMILESDQFKKSKKGTLKICVKDDELLVVEIGSKNMRMIRFGLEVFDQDLGLEEMKVEAVKGVVCPPMEDKFMVVFRTGEDMFRPVVFNWGKFDDAMDRIVNVGIEVKGMKEFFGVYSDEWFFLQYF